MAASWSPSPSPPTTNCLAPKQKQPSRKRRNSRTSPALQARPITPFVLAKIAELTGGRSKRANVALLLNNARVEHTSLRHRDAIQATRKEMGGWRSEIEI